MIYIASPYSHQDKNIEQLRYELVRAYTAQCLSEGLFVYSPIVHCHEITKHHNISGSYDFWQEYDNHMISISERFYVYMIDGWLESKGVKAEIEYAIIREIPVEYIKCE